MKKESYQENRELKRTGLERKQEEIQPFINIKSDKGKQGVILQVYAYTC
jgi:hypothetical protein